MLYRRWSRFGSVLCLVVAARSALGQTIIHVDDDAPPGGNGTSWATAFTHLQDALAIAAPGAEIRVAQGTYKPDRGVGQSLGNRAATFQLKNGVDLIGGYAGLGASEPHQRDIVLHETVLSGDLDGDDAPVACLVDHPDCDALGLFCSSGFCAIDAGKGENSRHVVTGNPPFTTATIDGFTITGGNADGPASLGNRGAGMTSQPNSSLTVNNCIFRGNSATGVGGGMYNDWNVSATMTNCLFNRNSAGLGGGILNAKANLAATNCMFRENSATGDGGGVNNQPESVVTVTNSAFIKNTSLSGGGMTTFSSSLAVTNCNFSGNSAAHGRGGGMATSSSSLTVTNCTFSGNSAAAAFATVGFGGGMFNSQTSPIVTNCTFYANTAQHNGGGIFNQTASSPTVTNTIFWQNADPGGMDGSAQIHDQPDSLSTVNYSDVQGGWNGAGGVGNIAADPLFVHAAGRDNIPGTLDDGLRLLPGSPAIDSARNVNVPVGILTDLAGNNRFIDDPNITDCPQADTDCGLTPIVDMGAYEFGGDDCNFNGIPDTCDLDCGDKGGVCDVLGCGLSNDADLNGIPDECQRILYVNDDASATNSCASWIDACPELQTALAKARRGDEIWVATGTYAPAGPGGDRSATFQLPSGVRAYGGFAGTESTIEERAALFDDTILSGDLLGDDLPVPCVSSVPDCDNHGRQCFNGSCILRQNADENSYHVVTGSGTDATAILDGFTITGGFASGPEVSNAVGGGMYNFFGSPTVVNCTFTANTAMDLVTSNGLGGGMFSQGGSPIVDHCTFTNNISLGGGGMANLTNTVRASHCTFSDNFAIGMVNSESSVFVDHCDFTGNYNSGLVGLHSHVEVDDCNISNNLGVGLSNGEGTLALFNSTLDANTYGMLSLRVTARVDRCTFTGNIGGGMDNRESSLLVTNCDYIGNNWYGMSNIDSSLTVDNCRFIGSNGVAIPGFAVPGLGMLNQESSPTVSNSTFIGNTGIATEDSPGFGAGMLNVQGSPTVNNCTFTGNGTTFVGNATGFGGGIVNGGGSPTISNCVLWGNSPDELFTNPDPGVDIPTVAFSDVFGGLPAGTIDGGGNIDADPLFVDADGADNILGTEDDDVRLSCGSPCIDSGDNGAVPADESDLDGDGNTTEPIPFDLDGNARLVDDTGTADTGMGTSPIVDMGGYEFHSTTVCNPGDLNCDCDVDLRDFASWVVCFEAVDPLGCNPTATPDLDGDGQVNFDDYALFLANLNGPDF